MTQIRQARASVARTRTARARAGSRRLYLLASVIVSFLAASSAPTSLYARYQHEWSFTALTTTVIFGVYAIAVLLALLVLGRISDQLGRRPVIMASIVGQVAALILFATASDVAALLGARVLQGISTGTAVGAVGAALLDVDRTRGTLLNALAPGTGTAVGALASAAVVVYLPAPQHLVYLVLVVVLLGQLVAVAFMTDLPACRSGPLRASLRPQLRVPEAVRVPVATATPVLVSVWALAGYYGSLGPSLIRQLAGSSSVVLGSLGLFTLAAVAVTGVFVLRRVPDGRLLTIGVAALVSGTAGVTVALHERSVIGFFLGTAVAGIGFGSGLQGSFRTVVPRTDAQDRAAVLAVLWIVSYLGLGVPAVVAGTLVAHGAGLIAVAETYNLAVILLAGLAAIGLVVQRTMPTHEAPPSIVGPGAE